MTMKRNNTSSKLVFDWSAIDTVLLDMDGTLLDKYFDDYFWEEFVPQVYAQTYNISSEQAAATLLKRYRSVESTLQWTDLDYWSDQLGLNIPELKRQVDHLISLHPYVVDFLQYIRAKHKQVYLVTAAHSKTLAIKLDKIAIGHFFDNIICQEEIGYPKEAVSFWRLLETSLGFDPTRTMLADDNPAVLEAADKAGIRHIIHMARASSQAPATRSSRYTSIEYFTELMSPLLFK